MSDRHKEPPHINGEDCVRPCGEHALVGDAYPRELVSFHCQWCGDNGNEACRYTYYSERAFDVSSCTECGHCDCAANGNEEPQAIMCQVVGECMGLAYDIVYDSAKDTVICLDCWEISPKPRL